MEERCDEIRSMLASHSNTLAKRDQLVFAMDHDEEEEEAHSNFTPEQIKALQRELYITCEDPSDSPYLQGSDLGSHLTGSLAGDATSVMDARLAILQFMGLATADEQVALVLAKSNAEELASSIASTFEHNLHADGRSVVTETLHNVPGTTAPVKARLGYVQSNEGKLNLVWHFEVAMDHASNSNFYQTTVDATTGEVRSVADWVSSAPAGHHDHAVIDAIVEEETTPEALYKVIRWGLNDPSEGNRTLEAGVRDSSYSPYGWHSIPGKSKNSTFHDTRGNNVFASAFGAGMDDWESPARPRPKGKKGEDDSMIFDYPFPWRAANKAHEELEPEKYADASTVNLFYTLNEYHDLLYLYGFTPAAGNFEEAEATEGGRGGDAIAAYAISSAGTNNADFTTPPDGNRPRVRM